MKGKALIGIVTLAGAGVLGAAESSREVYVSTGAHGETVYSDVARPGAQRIVLEAPPRQEDAMAELERRIEQTLTVANDLQESRLAREAARAERREQAAARAAAQQPPRVVYQDRYVGTPFALRPSGHRQFPHGKQRGPHRPGGKGNKPGNDKGQGPGDAGSEPEQSSPFLWRDDS